MASKSDVVAGALDHETLNHSSMRSWRGGATTELPRVFEYLPYGVSANMAVRRETWAAIGGWSYDFPFASGEDVDFSWRAQGAGYEIRFAPEAVVHYRHRSTILASARQTYSYAREGVLLYRRYRAYGACRRSIREVVWSYVYLATRLPFLLMGRKQRGYWVIKAAETAGRIAGSIRYRTLCP
jgi:GT2 family glycosyltransferase